MHQHRLPELNGNDESKETNDLYRCYVLRTDKNNLSTDEFWRLYVSLTREEKCFCYLKSDLGLRPIFHHIEMVVEAHIIITPCILDALLYPMFP